MIHSLIHALSFISCYLGRLSEDIISDLLGQVVSEVLEVCDTAVDRTVQEELE